MGFIADSTITGATNNYGFYGNIAAGTGRWNLFMAGTADNFINGKLGIGTTSLSAKLNIGAATTAQASLNIASGVLLATPVSGAIEYDGTNLYYTNSTATRHTLAISDSPVFTGTVSMPHLKGNSGAPTITLGPGAGTGASFYNVSGSNDMAGVIEVVTGSSPAGSGAIVATITFNTPYASSPTVILTPGTFTAAELTGINQVYVPSRGQVDYVNTTYFKIKVSSGALAPNTAYVWNYQVIL
jgi:hypothetical protein